MKDQKSANAVLAAIASLLILSACGGEEGEATIDLSEPVVGMGIASLPAGTEPLSGGETLSESEEIPPSAAENLIPVSTENPADLTPAPSEVMVPETQLVDVGIPATGSSTPPSDIEEVDTPVITPPVTLNSAPEIAGVPANEINVGNLYRFVPVATDVDADTLHFSISSTPAWAEFDIETGILSGTPLPGDDAIYADIVIAVTDAEFTVSLPPFNITVVQPNRAPTISGLPPPSAEVGLEYAFTPDANDSDEGDVVTFSIVNLPEWANFDSNTGSLSGIPEYTHVGSYSNIEILAADQSSQTALAVFSIEVTMDEVELALATGDASLVSSAVQLEDALFSEIENASNLHSEAIAQIFNLNADGSSRTDGTSLTSIDWNPTHDAAVLTAEFGENRDLLITNAVSNNDYDILNRSMAVIGESESRYMVMGGNPMRNYRRDADSINEQMHQFLENSLAWLADRDDMKTTPSSVVMAQLHQNYYFPDELGVREWLDERFPGQIAYNEQNDCDGSALADCIATGADLLIISGHLQTAGQEQNISDAVKAAMHRGVPVLYMHLDGGTSSLSDALLALLDVRHSGDNYWRRLSFDSYDPTGNSSAINEDVSAIKTMVSNFSLNSFGIDWSTCVEENCSANIGLETEFLAGASYARSLLTQLDKDKQNIFSIHNKFRFKKLLALLGDYYRKGVSFPMDKNDTPEIEFLRAYYADYSTYQYRQKVGVWSDMGNYSRTDFSHITPTSRTVNHISKKNFRSTGAYALPGQTVTVTRNDSSDVNVSVRVNTLRNGSTHIYADNGYKRPRLLQNQAMSIAPGETIQFTSPMGGTLQLEYSTNDLPVEVVFENIGEHAYWADSDDNSSFSEKLYADEFDWAEIAAPSFEVHSTREKMIESMANPMFGPDGGTPQALVDAIMRYVHNFPHVLAGFKGPGVDVVDEIHQFAMDNGLEVANLDLVKHMNADQATCGYGCSGNPYDAYWSFSPIGHGDIHELGHGLERSRFRFSSWDTHSTTNPYSYYTKSQYFKDTGDEPSCQSLPFETNFNVLQASFAAVEPSEYMQNNMWTAPNWSTSAAMTIQMMMSAQDNGALIDGWHLLARMHIIEREYGKAVRDDTVWDTKRAGLGMGNYSRLDARDMSKEDWLLIVVSHATGFDMRAYFDVWGHAYSATAATQVSAMGLPLMPLNYYVSTGKGYCIGEGFDGAKVVIDGVSIWPLVD